MPNELFKGIPLSYKLLAWPDPVQYSDLTCRFEIIVHPGDIHAQKLVLETNCTADQYVVVGFIRVSRSCCAGGNIAAAKGIVFELVRIAILAKKMYVSSLKGDLGRPLSRGERGGR